MPYFMVNIDVNAWDQQIFEVNAPTSGAALVRVLKELDAIETERVLHGIHVGPASDRPVTDAEMATWPKEDHFKRLDAVV